MLCLFIGKSNVFFFSFKGQIANYFECVRVLADAVDFNKKKSMLEYCLKCCVVFRCLLVQDILVRSMPITQTPCLIGSIVTAVLFNLDTSCHLVSKKDELCYGELGAMDKKISDLLYTPKRRNILGL